jgi:rhomboid family GlyGly-CTERM serine protease
MHSGARYWPCSSRSLADAAGAARAGALRARLARPGALWLLLSALLALPALAAAMAPPELLDWQPQLAWAEPWRWWSAAWVHGSAKHLWANLLATALVAAYGWAARAPQAIALAWLAAWPLTHLSLALRPELAHYVGLSGVLHAGVAAVTVWLVIGCRGAPRTIGWMMLAGHGIKLLSERPWAEVLHPVGELDVAVAPLAHAGGSIAGALLALLVLIARRRR